MRVLCTIDDHAYLLEDGKFVKHYYDIYRVDKLNDILQQNVDVVKDLSHTSTSWDIDQFTVDEVPPEMWRMLWLEAQEVSQPNARKPAIESLTAGLRHFMAELYFLVDIDEYHDIINKTSQQVKG